MKLGELYTEINVRDSGFRRSMAVARANLQKTGTGFRRMAQRGVAAFARLRAAATRFAVGIKAAGAAIVGFLNRIKMFALIAGGAIGLVVKNASDVAEQASKFKAVFKEEEDAARAFAKTLSQEIGRSRFKIMEMMATLQDTFVPLGYGRKEARLLSQQMTKLAIDVASFQNKASPEVLRDFQSALVGNHETVRKYGIIITEARMKQEALNSRLWDGKGELSAMAKVQARLNLIMQGTTDAQGDAKRTANQFANQMRKLWDKLYDLSVVIGNALIPVVQMVAGAIESAIPYVRQWLKENDDLVKSIMELIGTAIVETLKNIGNLFKIVFNILANHKGVIIALANSFKTLVKYLGKACKWLQEIATLYHLLSGKELKLPEVPDAGGAGEGAGAGGAAKPAAEQRITRPGFTKPNANTQIEPTVRTGTIAARKGGFTGIAELAKTIQQNVWRREEERRAKKMLMLSGRQLKSLEEIKAAIKEKGVGLAIT